MSTKVLINYKSGRQVDVRVNEFKVKVDGSGNKTFTWDLAEDSKVRPLYMNVDEVESVWQVL